MIMASIQSFHLHSCNGLSVIVVKLKPTIITYISLGLHIVTLQFPKIKSLKLYNDIFIVFEDL
jgi:hypothetical protein